MVRGGTIGYNRRAAQLGANHLRPMNTPFQIVANPAGSPAENGIFRRRPDFAEVRAELPANGTR
jgi:hypothetical protein